MIDLIRLSKFMSLVLRHRPEIIGAELDPGGWVSITLLCQGAQKNGVPLTENALRRVVTQNDKQRFTIDKTDTKIRANQGHSLTIDLGLIPHTPPTQLYHGTAEHCLASIRKIGLCPQSRNHVHLSENRETATKVGQRHGYPVVLTIDTKAMLRDGLVFYCSENGVWLTDRVLPQYLIFPN